MNLSTQLLESDENIVPISCAASVAAHVVDGRIARLTISIDDLEIEDEALKYFSPTPAPEAVEVVRAAIQSNTLPALEVI